jgi:hypothetical protein
MTDSVKFFKIKLIKKLLKSTEQAKNQLLDELIINATDPTIIKRRLRMIKNLNSYESQLIEKIQQFNTDDANDLVEFETDKYIHHIINRSA